MDNNEVVVAEEVAAVAENNTGIEIETPFINALIAVNVFPFLALPLMITIFMRVSSNFRFSVLL